MHFGISQHGGTDATFVNWRDATLHIHETVRASTIKRRSALCMQCERSSTGRYTVHFGISQHGGTDTT